MIKKIGASSIALTGIGTGITVADTHQSSGLDTRFDPDNQPEVYEFVDHLHELDRDDGERVLKSLTRERQVAVAEAMKPVDYTVDTEYPLQSFDSDTDSIIRTVTAKSATGNFAYRYKHTFSWEWEDGVVIDASGDAGPDGTGLPWKYIGDSVDDVLVADDAGKSFQTGEFGLCIYVPTCVVTERGFPYINIFGYPDGLFDVASDDDGNNSPG